MRRVSLRSQARALSAGWELGIHSGEMVAGGSFSHYRILKKIGQGGLGEVFVAEDTILNRKVALKFLSAEVEERPDIRARFLVEARSAAAIDHPFVCKVYETGEA